MLLFGRISSNIAAQLPTRSYCHRTAEVSIIAGSVPRDLAAGARRLRLAQQGRHGPSQGAWARRAATNRIVTSHALPTPGPFVDVAWLKRSLEDVRVYDARGADPTRDGCGEDVEAGADDEVEPTAAYDAYLEGHVPGAVFFNWTRDGARALLHPASDPRSDTEPSAATAARTRRRRAGGRVAVELDPDVWLPCYEARGLSLETPVVVYDDGDGLTAARVWLQLLAHGHPATRMLAGGWAGWLAAGGEAELYEPCPLKLSTTYEGTLREERLAGAAELLRAAAGAAAAPGGAAVAAASVAVAVLVTRGNSHGRAAAAAAELLPGARHLHLSALLSGALAAANGRPGRQADERGVGGGGGALSLADAAGLPQPALAAAIKAQLGGGVEIGPGSAVRVILASEDSVGACAAAALLEAAGHRNWAVCDDW